MAVHMFKTLILLFMVETCVAKVETIEFRLGDRKIRVPLDKPAIVELNEDGELEDIRIPDQKEINKPIHIPSNPTEISSTPQRHYLETGRQIPIQRTFENYHHSSQPNIYNYYPPANQEYHQHQPMNQYPEAQFLRYPQDKQLLQQHYPVPNLQPVHYSEQIQTQPHYPNEYRKPYHQPTYDPHQRSHVQNLQHVPAYYPNSGYRDPYYGNNFPRSHPQENYVSNSYLPKNFDYNRHNPSTYHPRGPDLLNTREFPGARPLDPRIKRIEPQRDPIYSQNSPPIAPTNINLPSLSDLQNYKNAFKPPQSSEYQPLPHKSTSEPAQAPVQAIQDNTRSETLPESQKYKYALKSPQSLDPKPLQYNWSPVSTQTPTYAAQDKSRHARPHSVDTFRTLRPNLKQKSTLQHIYRKPQDILKSQDLLRAPLTLHNRPIGTETKPIAPSQSIENMLSKIPVSPAVVSKPSLPSITRTNKRPTSLVNNEKEFLQPIVTTSKMSPQEADRTIVKKISQDHQYITTVLPPSNFPTNFPSQDSSIKNSAISTSDSPSVLSSTMQAADISSVQNSTDNSKYSSLTQYTTKKEPEVIETTDLLAQNIIIDVAPELLPILETTSSNPETSPSMPYTLDAAAQNDANKTFANDTTTNIPVTIKPEIHSELHPDIQYTTTDFPLMNKETEFFITTNNPVQKTNIKSNETSDIYKLISNKVTESLVSNATSDSFTPSFIQETIASTPELAPTLPSMIADAFEQNESIAQVSTDPVTNYPEIFTNQYSNTDHKQNTQRKYSHVEFTTISSLANIATEPSDNDITTDEIFTLSPAEDTSFANGEITYSFSHTTSNKTEKKIPMEQNANEILLQSSSTETQPSLPLTQNSTLSNTKGAVSTKGKTRRRPCKKHRKKKTGHKGSNGYRRRRRRTTTPSTIPSAITTLDSIT